MSVANIYAYPDVFTWNGNTFNSGGGGPIRLEVMDSGQVLEEGTGGAVRPTYTQSVLISTRVRVTITDISQAATLAGTINTVANATAGFLPKPGGADYTLHMANLVLLSVDPIEQTRLQRGGVTLLFGHQSADGTTNCLS